MISVLDVAPVVFSRSRSLLGNSMPFQPGSYFRGEKIPEDPGNLLRKPL